MGGRDRRRGAHPGARRPRLLDQPRRAGPGRSSLALPEDMLAEACVAADAAPYRAVQAHPGAMTSPVCGAARHGGAPARDRRRWWLDRAGVRRPPRLREANGLPTGASFRCQDYLDNRSSRYVGDVGLAINPALARRVQRRRPPARARHAPRRVDHLGLHARRGSAAAQRLVHVHPGVEELGRVYQADLAIASGLPELCAALRALEPVDGTRWAAWADDGPRRLPRTLGAAAGTRARSTSARSSATCPIGCRRTRSSRTAPATSRSGRTASTGSGATGPSLPRRAARWATGCRRRSRRRSSTPSRIVVCLSGDGDFLMNGQELATASSTSSRSSSSS